ncbi:probable (S)-N-methylcoclaurine 3'-hydroxylase isozyme 2 isoform X1 [Cornus florida]|uniref:probable (S)-N-methylcoclaurine 3'-hydroxylase isozyme 2 isoform X1 n=1 Tax=Cornus florida TaxID=4283 RepID=UPI0028A0A8D0|nr:probable (S)-N-methylcoclaurine 3'-hydroxylase isozyme 2 isoform X1 [Cornus florida]
MDLNLEALVVGEYQSEQLTIQLIEQKCIPLSKILGFRRWVATSFRTASCDKGMMNYTIPKNSQVLVNVWAIGRDLMIWEDPLNFKPERFLNSTLDFKGTDFEFLPFGAGRRIFPALPMAAKLVPLIVASLS